MKVIDECRVGGRSFRVESERRLFNISIAIDGTKAAAHGVESCSEASGWLREAGADWDWDWILGLQLGCVDEECSMGKEIN